MSDYIPLEIQVEIFRRLPVKSLLQFRSVSKSWKCVIDSSEFIGGYGVHQTQPPRLFEFRVDKTYISLVDTETFLQKEMAPTIPVLSKFLTMPRVVGSSHGLMCLYGNYIDRNCTRGREVAVLWNPSIKKSVSIAVRAVVEDLRMILGFGVCPIARDPTIIKICMSKNEACEPWVVEVFTLSTGSWRILTGNLPTNLITVTWIHVVIDRFIYFLAYDNYKKATETNRPMFKCLIMSFNMTTHEFGTVEIPDSLARRRSRWELSISKVSEALAVVVKDEYLNGGCCDVWIMDHGVPNSFTKIFSVSLQGGILWSGGGLAHEPVFKRQYFSEYWARSFVPYNHYITDIGIIEYGHSIHVGMYMETLLLLDQPDCSVYVEDSVVPMDFQLWINSPSGQPCRFGLFSLLRKLRNIFKFNANWI